ncbi:Alkylated DNA nucleotide flippase Atl1, participates in nucleotide excision repair, Ada-like DNA-binding domain [Agrococcus baldri]|uniref:Alkylated DNA nucleotide flippase Atl1, participates in nucleotide excision repair, Ada-like DNA-binding domain n=1 Tax=Agrococcus baldri TaxID=153730 RepID=A0AA94HLF7_9MICO|nr:MGMT family protein [Agrococcus baldri]SFS06951.1 Alkylated DNA nucleotide flippase Atl1, participates in nucleotide excision repair, Ada-like DNA-binding domain [Agrococcus baldri]
MDARRELVIERVLRCIELVPAGRVASYGAIAAICGIGPRQVGSIMRHWSGDLAWWRITNASGDFPGDLLDRARPHWEEEGIAVKPNGLGCRYADYAADMGELELQWREATADLPDPDADDLDASA